MLHHNKATAVLQSWCHLESSMIRCNLMQYPTATASCSCWP